MKGATGDGPAWGAASLFQSTLPMKGATRGMDIFLDLPEVSIHAPNEGSDRRRATA